MYLRRVSGFTLIELIMVIVILGVLSAFALPRFADLGGDARVASLNALAGNLRSAANIAHAQQLADGASGSTGVTLDGVAITMVGGYPTADADGISAAAQVSSDYVATEATGTLTYDLNPARTNCNVVYTAADGTTQITAGVTVTTSGCN
ncbi:pilin [Parathalassolituus penaei]|uniref:Type II secretion system protein n=1 Tax=Parathalassolituus penaei TaxID=2997323 RepID=A0A9X3EC98_9GAMM|nr:type II secretion system protein [Parathalassolituus penaei]MCY0964204.1 type II secretion system protein [Parathalassolituus penaei]